MTITAISLQFHKTAVRISHGSMIQRVICILIRIQSSLITDLLEMYTGKSNKEMDEIMISALSEATKGFLLDFAFDNLPSKTGKSYRHTSDESSRAFGKVGSAKTFSKKRDWFYYAFSNGLKNSCIANYPECIVNVILLEAKYMNVIFNVTGA